MSENNTPINRRRFGGILAATGAAASTLAAQDDQTRPNPNRPAPGNWRRPMVPDTPAFEAPIEFKRQDVALKAEPFKMGQVKLLPGSVYHDAHEWNRGYMSRLSADRLLYTFRANAGLATGDAKRSAAGSSPTTASAPANSAATSAATTSPPSHSLPPAATRRQRPKATTWSPKWLSARTNSAVST